MTARTIWNYDNRLAIFVPKDGAARVLDPVFSHLLDPTWLLRGKFFKHLGQKHAFDSSCGCRFLLDLLDLAMTCTYQTVVWFAMTRVCAGHSQDCRAEAGMFFQPSSVYSGNQGTTMPLSSRDLSDHFPNETLMSNEVCGW